MRVVIQLDRERELRFDGMALAALERATGASILQILSRFGEGDVPFHFVLAMLKVGLQNEFPGRTEQQILRLVERHGSGGTTFEQVMSFAVRCSEALADALPKGDAKNRPAPELNPGNDGTGKPTSDSVTASASCPVNSGA
jgi:hypothetical protein